MIRRTLILAAAALTLAAAPAGVSVTDGWSRPAAQGGNGAGFLTIVNVGQTADRLLSASSPVAGRVEIHESMIMGGRAMMHPRPEGAPVAPGARVEFKPGGWHLMLMGLKKPLKAGETVPVTLTFQKAGRVQVDLAVRATPPATTPPGGEHHH